MAVPSKGVDRQRAQGVAVGRRLALASAPPVLPSAAADFEAQRTLPRTLDRLEEHSGEIHRDWSAQLERQGFTPDDVRAVSALALAPAIAHIRGGGFDAYARALESAGQELARWGMPEPRAMAALEALLESSVRHVGGAPGDAATLVRLAFAGSLALTTGYAGARTTSWRSFGEQERQRLSRDLHDEIGHHLVVLKLYLGLIVTELAKARPSRIREKLDEATDLVSQAIQSVRRLILDLGPVALEGVGFLPAVKLYARQFGARTGVKVHVRDRGLPARLPATPRDGALPADAGRAVQRPQACGRAGRPRHRQRGGRRRDPDDHRGRRARVRHGRSPAGVRPRRDARPRGQPGRAVPRGVAAPRSR